MKGTKLVATALLSLTIWTLIYLFSTPPKTDEEVLVVVIFSAIVVYGVDFLWSHWRKQKGGSDE